MTNADLQGRLAADPQTHHAGDTTVTRLRIIAQQSSSEREREEAPFGVDVEAWGPFGQALGQLHKGDPVVILGSWKTSVWTDKTTGDRRTKNFIRAYAGGPDLAWSDVTGLTRRAGNADTRTASGDSAAALAAGPAAAAVTASTPATPATTPAAASAASDSRRPELVDPFDED